MSGVCLVMISIMGALNVLAALKRPWSPFGFEIPLMFPPRLSSLNHLRNRQFLTGTVTLVCFLMTSVGFPLEPVGMPRSGCQCGKELQQSNRCCCVKAVSSGCCQAETRSCCARKQIKSCCAGKTKQSPEETPVTPEISACGCGGSPAGGVLVNNAPRLQAKKTVIPETTFREKYCPQILVSFSNHSMSPETPPPEVCCL
ncbi:MAG: hypothetical protein ABIK07_02340 [Planctomycetota bacterium]